MRLDLKNVITVAEADEGPGGKVVVRHRAFPEIQAGGNTPGEALLALQSILRRSAGWTTDTWHANDLAHAIIDLESILRLLDCSDEAMSYRGRGSLLVKDEDLIYYSSDRPVEAGVSPANPVDVGSAFVDPPCDASETDSLLIYTLGRRRAMRRQPEDGEAPRPGLTDRRASDRRSCDRRQHNRIRSISDVPDSSDRPGVPAMAGSNRVGSNGT